MSDALPWEMTSAGQPYAVYTPGAGEAAPELPEKRIRASGSAVGTLYTGRWLMPQQIIQAVSLSASPDRLFDTYLNPAAHAAVTGAAVTIAARPGAPFQAFNGALSGTILHVELKRLIVQTWRSVNFPAGALDSVLVLSFWPEQGGGRIELVHVNVPEEDFAGVSAGWEKYYWGPWRAALASSLVV